MRVVNICDIKLIKALLRKLYITVNIDYDFLEPHDGIKQKIRAVQPEIVVVQDLYSDITGLEIIKGIKKEIIDMDIHVVYLSSDSIYEDKIELENVEIVDNRNLPDSMYRIITNITHKMKMKQQLLIKNQQKRKILFVDDDKLMHKLIDDTLSKNEYQVIHAYNGEEAYEFYNELLPSLIVTDIEMPKMDGLKLCKKIKQNNAGRFIPIIVLSSKSNPLDIDTAFNTGADDYLTKPVVTQELLNKVEEYFSAFDRKKNDKILVVDDNKLTSEIIRHAFMRNGINVLIAYNGQDAIDIIKKEHPQVVVTDIEMPIMNGYELCEKIKADPTTKDIYLVMMSYKDKPCDIKKGQKLGVVNFFTKPFDVEKMVVTIEQLLLEKYRMYEKEYEYMLSTIHSLINALEARDEYTKGHTERVSKLVGKLGQFMGLEKKILRNLELAANLHDIGKIGVRDDILLKHGKLNDEEYAKIQEHAIIGAEILKPISSLNDIIPLILLHHERWDGKGYPNMLKGDDIPIGARMIAVIDAYDAITTDRPYRKALTTSYALDVIRQNAGTQFCPDCAQAFIQMMESEQNEQ